MFTGIISAMGKVTSRTDSAEGCRIRIGAGKLGLADVSQGDSIAVSGVCLTVAELEGETFSADVSLETLACTTFGDLQAGSPVNLEKAMLPATRFGGHIISGHVDGIATLVSRRPDGNSDRLRFEVPVALSRYIARKGSVCIDGVSLTVNEVDGPAFEVNIIPHTASETIIHLYEPGMRVNLEVDIISRYLERLLEERERSCGPEQAKEKDSGLTLEFLQRHGFAPRDNDG